MTKELYEMNSQCSEVRQSDSTELPRTKPEEDPGCGEERASRYEPKISSVSTDMQKELYAEASLDDTASTSPMDGDGDDVLKRHWPVLEDDNGRERLKRHRTEVAGEVWIPDLWGQEDLLMDWVDCSAFDTPLVLGKIVSARAALVDEGRKANTARLRIENRCLNFYSTS